jgi:hypothetical protein
VTFSLAIIANVLADLTLIGGLGYVMSRTTRLTPHVAAIDPPPAPAVVAWHRSSVGYAERPNAAFVPVHS